VHDVSEDMEGPIEQHSETIELVGMSAEEKETRGAEASFGFRDARGISLMAEENNQELTHLETFWEELASKTHTGEFFTTSMEALRLELRYPTSLMLVPFDRMARCATNSWLTSLWETCDKWNIDIKSISPELKRARVYDQFVMQALAQDKISQTSNSQSSTSAVASMKSSH